MAESKQDNQLPLHARVSEVPIRTPVDVRLGLAVAPARYLPRGLARLATDSNSPDFIKRRTLEPLQQFFAPRCFNILDARLQKISEADINSVIYGKDGSLVTNADEILRNMEKGGEKWETLFKDIAQIQRPWGAGGRELVENTVKHALSAHATSIEEGTKKVLSITKKSRVQKLLSPMSNVLFETGYDNMLGVGALGMAYAIRQRVMNDMTSLFTEVVAYEKDKDPSQITKSDIFNSDNLIISSTTSNYRSKMVQRLGISLMPFLKNVPSIRALPFGDLQMGMWGLLWSFDIWGRQPTMLELLSDFANDKLNPKFGIGDKVKPTDIINLYQQYAIKFHPDWALKSIQSNDPAENRLWAHSEKVFDRIADLMNNTYNYKHPAHIDETTGLPEPAANFPLPKFIFLLGNGLINAQKPEWSKAYIEIADQYGMKAVKEVQQAEKEGAALKDVLTKYPVDLGKPSATQHQLEASTRHPHLPSALVHTRNAEISKLPLERPSQLMA